MATECLLDVPYLSQHDNVNNPNGSCNVTSVAMCMRYLGIVGDGSGQLEDQLYTYMEANRLSRHTGEDLQKLWGTKPGIQGTFTRKASWDDIKAHLDSGNPCILHGYFTAFGHVVVANGYRADADGNLVDIHLLDPWGEWHRDGYDTWASGQYWISKSTLSELCEDADGIWCHFPSRKPPVDIQVGPQVE